MHHSPAIIIDNGSGFTKVGFSGAAEPQCIFQSAIGRSLKKNKDSPLSDLEFATGGDDTLRSFGSNYESIFPIKHGIIQDWDAMENLWTNCFYEKLRVNTEDHPILLTETPLNTPENREQAAEILFETFNVPALNISVQAVLSLASSWANENVTTRELTGTVIDSGYGSTQIVPVVDGHVMSRCIEQYPIGGREVTSYIQQLMRERKEPVPSDMGVETARAIKERFTYTCPNIEKECERFDSNPEMYIQQYESIHKKTGKAWSCNVEYERFLAPEVVMDPKMYDPSIQATLPEMVDAAIHKCPIDTRRNLYSNIVLSGGNTVFKDFGRRLQRDVKKLVESRLSTSRAAAGTDKYHQASDIKDFVVNVAESSAQTSSVWLGGSILASADNFLQTCYTKAQYEEEGSRIFRQNVAFKAKF